MPETITTSTPTSTSDPAQFYGESVVSYTSGGTTGTPTGEGGSTGTPISGTYYPFPVKPISSPVTVAAPAQQEATQLQTEIQKAQTAPPVVPESTYDATALKTAYQPDVYTQRREQLAQRRTASEQAIEADFARRQREVEGAQAKATGQQAKTISRLGGWLGETGSGEMAMQNLELRNRQEITDLLAAKQMALLKAQQLFEDQDFSAAQAELSNAKELDKEVYNRQRQFQSDKAVARKTQADIQEKERQAQGKAMETALKYNVKAPYYSIDGVNIIDTRTGLLVDANTLDPNAKVQIIEKQPEPSDFMVVDLADGKYLMNKLTGEKQFVGELEADIKEIDVENRVKLVNMQTGEIVVDLGAKSYRATGGGTVSESGLYGQNLKRYQSAIEDAKQRLKAGEDWGDVWDKIKADFPDVPNEVIDNDLGTIYRDWREKGLKSPIGGEDSTLELINQLSNM